MKGGSRVGSGPKVIDINIKKAKGTLRNHREKKKVPVSSDLPIAPLYLSPRAKEIFSHLVSERLVGMGIASASHTETLAMVSQEMAELEIIDKIIETEGHTFKKIVKIDIDEDGNETIYHNIKARPELQAQKELRRHIHTILCGEFGLSPGSSGRVSSTKPADKPDNPFGNI